MTKLTKPLFYILSFTWGILINIAGSLVALFMLATFHKPHIHGWCVYFIAGKKRWGGMEWGIFFITDRQDSETIKNHEFGHAIQNCFFGPFMICISVCSSVRYWTRRLMLRFHKTPKHEYDSIWFERQATELGTAYYNRINCDKIEP